MTAFGAGGYVCQYAKTGNPQTFNLKTTLGAVGNGIVNDGTAFTNLLLQMHAGDTVTIPAGVYVVGADITVNKVGL